MKPIHVTFKHNTMWKTHADMGCVNVLFYEICLKRIKNFFLWRSVKFLKMSADTNIQMLIRKAEKMTTTKESVKMGRIFLIL